MRFWPPKQLISFILGFLTAYIMITYLWVCKGGCQLEGNGSNSGKSIELKLLSERTVNITSSQTELASLPQRPITLNIKSSKEHVIEVENKLKQSEYKLTRSYPFSEENEFVDIYSLENPPQEDNPQFWEKAKHYNVDDYGTPVENYVLDVTSMKKLPLEKRLQIFKERNIKTVLFLHAAYGDKLYAFNFPEYTRQGQLPYIMKGCRNKDCFCTDDRDFLPLEEFDALVFYARMMRPTDLPKVRKPNQHYILWEMESPSNLFGFSPRAWGNIFNWTHTYRRDSDIWNPWGMMNQISPFPKSVNQLIEEKKNDNSTAFTKTKSVAWFVSNCFPPSGRQKFVKDLQRYIQVDVYGRCGTLQCPPRSHEKCWDMVEKEYFFYFSAENSLCKDYITEKFFFAMQHKVIPIAFGGGLGTNDYYFAPKKSYINAFDFKGPKELAEFLLKLQNDPAEYKSYFWWKPYYNIWHGRMKKPYCDVCDQLHRNDKNKTYKDVQDWWVTQAKCRHY